MMGTARNKEHKGMLRQVEDTLDRLRCCMHNTVLVKDDEQYSTRQENLRMLHGIILREITDWHRIAVTAMIIL